MLWRWSIVNSPLPKISTLGSGSNKQVILRAAKKKWWSLDRSSSTYKWVRAYDIKQRTRCEAKVLLRVPEPPGHQDDSSFIKHLTYFIWISAARIRAEIIEQTSDRPSHTFYVNTGRQYSDLRPDMSIRSRINFVIR